MCETLIAAYGSGATLEVVPESIPNCSKNFGGACGMTAANICHNGVSPEMLPPQSGAAVPLAR